MCLEGRSLCNPEIISQVATTVLKEHKWERKAEGTRSKPMRPP